MQPQDFTVPHCNTQEQHSSKMGPFNPSVLRPDGPALRPMPERTFFWETSQCPSQLHNCELIPTAMAWQHSFHSYFTTCKANQRIKFEILVRKSHRWIKILLKELGKGKKQTFVGFPDSSVQKEGLGWKKQGLRFLPSCLRPVLSKQLKETAKAPL